MVSFRFLIVLRDFEYDIFFAVGSLEVNALFLWSYDNFSAEAFCSFKGGATKFNMLHKNHTSVMSSESE